MAQVILFANGNPGLSIARFLVDQGEKIRNVYYYGDEKYKNALAKALNVDSSVPLLWTEFKREEKLLDLVNDPADFMIAVYWPYLLRGEELKVARDSVNFHPAFLPINRGWYPHVHSIIDGTLTGVTLHRIASGADTGEIWTQEKVELLSTDTASDIYFRLQNQIIRLFKENWPAIRDGEMSPFPQDESVAIYRKKSDIDKLDQINLEAPTTARELINILRSRTFLNNGYAYFIDDEGAKIRIAISLVKQE